MSVIIRLQNLAWEATAGDIRHFFAGLSIPDGNVHIVGGAEGDVFIGFATDEDARRAMAKNGQQLKSTYIRLLLSSRVEMNQVIDAARRENERASPSPSPTPTPVPMTIDSHSFGMVPFAQPQTLNTYKTENQQSVMPMRSQAEPFGQQQQQQVPQQQYGHGQQRQQQEYGQRPGQTENDCNYKQQASQPLASHSQQLQQQPIMHTNQAHFNQHNQPQQHFATNTNDGRSSQAGPVCTPPRSSGSQFGMGMQSGSGPGQVLQSPVSAYSSLVTQLHKTDTLLHPEEQGSHQMSLATQQAQAILNTQAQQTHTQLQRMQPAVVSVSQSPSMPSASYYSQTSNMSHGSADMIEQSPIKSGRAESSRPHSLLPMSPWMNEQKPLAQPAPQQQMAYNMTQQEPTQHANNNSNANIGQGRTESKADPPFNASYPSMATAPANVPTPAPAPAAASRKGGLLPMPPPGAEILPTQTPMPKAMPSAGPMTMQGMNNLADLNLRITMSVPPPNMANLNLLAPQSLPDSNPLERSRHVRLENLPPDCMHFRSLKSFLRPVPLSGDHNLVLLRDPTSHRPLPIAIVRLETDRDFHYVMSMDGVQGVRTSEATSADFELAACNFNDRVSQAMANGQLDISGPPVPMGGSVMEDTNRDNRSCIRLENVPYRATGRDITAWLSTLNVPAPAKIQQVPKEEGRYSDTWLLEFNMRRDATSLLDVGQNRAKMLIHGRTVRVQRGAMCELDKSMTGVGHGERRPDRRGGGRERSPSRSRRRRSRSPFRRDSDRRGDNKDSDNRRPRRTGASERDRQRESSRARSKDSEMEAPSVVQLTGVPSGVTAESIQAIFSAGFGDTGTAPAVIRVEMLPDGQAQVHFSDASVCQKAADRGDVFIGTTRVRVRAQKQRTAQSYIQKAVKPDTNQDHLQHHEQKPRVKPEPLFSQVISFSQDSVDQAMLREIGPVGCVLRVAGLPPNMRLEQLSALFDRVGGLVESSVRLHYAPDGSPTGDCLLAVFSAASAQAACNSLTGTQLAPGHTLTVNMAY